MLQIRAKKLTEGYAVNVDYIDIDTYTDVLNMLCAINEEIVTTLHAKQPESMTLHKSDYYGGVIAILNKLKQQDEEARADGVQVQQQQD